MNEMGRMACGSPFRKRVPGGGKVCEPAKKCHATGVLLFLREPERRI
jgi:hypothetical protein